MHGGKKTTTTTAASWKEVSWEVFAILIESREKPSSLQRYKGVLSRGEGGKTERERTLKCWLKFLPSLSSSVTTRDEKAGGTTNQQTQVDCLEMLQRRASLAL